MAGWSPPRTFLYQASAAPMFRLPELNQGAQIDGDSLDGKYRESPKTDWQQSNEVKTKIGDDLDRVYGQPVHSAVPVLRDSRGVAKVVEESLDIRHVLLPELLQDFWNLLPGLEGIPDKGY